MWLVKVTSGMRISKYSFTKKEQAHEAMTTLYKSIDVDKLELIKGENLLGEFVLGWEK